MSQKCQLSPETSHHTAAPELAGHVQAVGFDGDTGHLDVVPEAPAYGTKLRWSGR
ncbi:hypothetical protein QQM39_00035 [Streptomyces sp. DT2A-34]|uniref:hypothetical protein n=1 Tax=Streptomyces sp. DT2A-34 TaxID=3051182 RepID=UPI00265BE8EA|nr:hypothetical protein [Streptomyces sp. DT2A-34]MDO0909319.1 hypothetical protein [Streptomyces sp. DT2A-34]